MPMPRDTSRELPRELVELLKAVNALDDKSRAHLAPFLDEVIDSTARRRRLLGLVNEAIGQLRLDMKYLMFDLDATRRERDEALA